MDIDRKSLKLDSSITFPSGNVKKTEQSQRIVTLAKPVKELVFGKGIDMFLNEAEFLIFIGDKGIQNIDELKKVITAGLKKK